MKRIAPGIFLLLLSGLILILISCTPDSCFEETESFLKASFYGTTGKIQTPDSLTIYGLNMETNKLYNKALKLQSILLPLNSSVGNCTYIIKINAITDTVTFRYHNYPHLISKECGITFYHNLYTDSLFFTKHAIVSIDIKNNVITTLNEENVRILY